MSLRRCLLTKLVAAWFVLLIVLPFTAPFQAWDPGAPVGKTPSHELKSSDKLSTDAGLAASRPSLTADVVVGAAPAGIAIRRFVGSGAVLTPLRI